MTEALLQQIDIAQGEVRPSLVGREVEFASRNPLLLAVLDRSPPR